MISAICGLPGAGKNVYATYLAKKHFKKNNSVISRLIRMVKKEEIYVNNVYTTYPILLKKRKDGNIYTNTVSLYDLNNKYSFQKHSLIIIDEVQAFFDSEEHKDFPEEIAVFNQFHRHFDIDDIYYISQHPSRIVKRLRVLSSKFDKIRKFIIIPFVNIGIMCITTYFEFDDYGKYHHMPKEFRTYDYRNKIVFFRVNKVFKSYDSKYLKVLNVDKPLYDNREFKDLYLDKEELNAVFKHDVFAPRVERRPPRVKNVMKGERKNEW